jgi:large subunit ribosomal protein L24
MTAIKLKIRKGDTVIVHTGRDKGKIGEVLSVIKADSKLFIKGVNIVKRHVKATASNTGGIVSKELPIHISNVALLDRLSGLGTKVGFKFEQDGTKIRYAKKNGQSL